MNTLIISLFLTASMSCDPLNYNTSSCVNNKENHIFFMDSFEWLVQGEPKTFLLDTEYRSCL